jgi:hypothetical protein
MFQAIMAKPATNKVGTIKLWKNCSEFTFQIQNGLMIQVMDGTSRTWAYAEAEQTGVTGTWPNA